MNVGAKNLAFCSLFLLVPEYVLLTCQLAVILGKVSVVSFTVLK